MPGSMLTETECKMFRSAYEEAKARFGEGVLLIGSVLAWDGKVVIADDPNCIAPMQRMQAKRPRLWAEDIAED